MVDLENEGDRCFSTEIAEKIRNVEHKWFLILDYICDDEVATEGQCEVWAAYRNPAVTRIDSPLQVDELEVTLLPQGSRVVHRAWPCKSWREESLREHAHTFWRQPKSLYSGGDTSQEANHEIVDDQQASRVYLHSSRPTEKKNIVWAVSSFLLNVWSHHEHRQAWL